MSPLVHSIPSSQAASTKQQSNKATASITTTTSIMQLSILSLLSVVALLFSSVSAVAVQKRDSAEILSPLPGAIVSQDSAISVKVFLWGMSYLGSVNYTVQNDDNIVVYGPVALDVSGYSNVNMSVIGIGSWKIVLTQEQFVLNYTNMEREPYISTTVVPFTVVDKSDLPPTTTVDVAIESTTPIPSVTAEATTPVVTAAASPSATTQMTSEKSSAGRTITPNLWSMIGCGVLLVAMVL